MVGGVGEGQSESRVGVGGLAGRFPRCCALSMQMSARHPGSGSSLPSAHPPKWLGLNSGPYWYPYPPRGRVLCRHP